MASRTAGIRFTVLMACAFVGSMLVTVSYAPTLYRLFCGATGFGGTTRRATGPVAASNAAGSNPKLKVLFDTNIAPGLDWSFKPEQRSIDVDVNSPTTVYFDATNNTDQVNVARAVYNVTPPAIAPYFYKIQCFCFTEERLEARQTARMPVVFYIDDNMLKDASARGVQELTLSYTFYNQKNLLPGKVAGARDLKAGSVAEVQQKTAGDTLFENDAQRRQEP
ncbi:cytochrome c oxidase assembly protein [Labrys okinawensis]|uniref:cytochrome c oxidase assembly protein n=1 Tax=Labrys okinawensis TaxID=346911 RepID=UPI0039BC6CDD